ncbi:MAG: hypothetical protein K1X35_10060 [Caulobacteraceae bacterium]|nr:hypothetical protein [Caulobacteraceae bacterium]
MNKAILWKGGGYLISSVSVLLLGLVSWDGAKEHPGLQAALVAGVATSIIGMGMRFRAFLNGQRAKEANSRRLDRLEAALSGQSERRTAA